MSIGSFFPNGKCSTKARESVAKKRRRQTIFSWEEDSAELGGKVAIDVLPNKKNNSTFTKNAGKKIMEVVTSLLFKETQKNPPSNVLG